MKPAHGKEMHGEWVSGRRFHLFEPLSRRNRNRPTFAYTTHLAVALLISCLIARHLPGGLEAKQK
jgi:hypothetical protein